MSTYNPENVTIIVNGNVCEGFSDEVLITQKKYTTTDLSLYSEKHPDYSTELVKVNTPTIAFFINKDSDTYRTLVDDDGNTEITINFNKDY